VLNLVRYDLRIATNSFRAAFSSIRDCLALALMIAFAAVFAADFLGDFSNTQIQPSRLVLAAYFGLTAFFVCAFALHRVVHFAEHSPLAFFALDARSRRAYLGFWLGMALLLDYFLVGTLYAVAGDNPVAAPLRDALAFGWAACLGGAAAALLWRRAVERMRPWLGRARLGPRPRELPPEKLPQGRFACLLNVTVRRQSFVGRTTAAAFLCVAGAGIAIGLLGIGLRRLLSEAESLAVLALLVLFALTLLSRLNAGRLHYLRFLGFSPLAPGLMPVVAMALLAAIVALFLPVVAPTYAVPAAGRLLALLLLFGLVAYLRSLHYRLKTRSRADFAIQVDGLCIALLGFAFAPLALVFVVVRVYRLQRAARAATWCLS
jgi:hypothetical protein